MLESRSQPTRRPQQTPSELLAKLRLRQETGASKRRNSSSKRNGPSAVRRSVPAPPPPPPQQQLQQPRQSQTRPASSATLNTAPVIKQDNMDLFFFQDNVDNDNDRTPYSNPNPNPNTAIPPTTTINHTHMHDVPLRSSQHTCTSRFITFAVYSPLSALFCTLFVPVVLSIIALTSFTLEIDVALSSFEVSNTHPVAIHADAVYVAQKSWQKVRDDAKTRRSLFSRLLFDQTEEEEEENKKARSLAGSVTGHYIDRMELVFHPIDGKNVLLKEYLLAVREMESIIENVTEYTTFCWKPFHKSTGLQGKECAPPNRYVFI